MDASDFVDTIRTVPGSADAFMDPLRIQRIDTYGPSIASSESVSVLNFMNRQDLDNMYMSFAFQ